MGRRGVGPSALEGVWDDSGIGADGVKRGEVLGVAKFTGSAAGKHKADTGNTGEHGIGSGSQCKGGIDAEFVGVAVETFIKINGSG